MISKGFFSLFLLRNSSWFLLVCHWLNYRLYPHLFLSPAIHVYNIGSCTCTEFCNVQQEEIIHSDIFRLLDERVETFRNALLPVPAMAHVNGLWAIPRKDLPSAWLDEVKRTDYTISASKTGYSERSIRTARYHIHHFIHHLSQNFLGSWRVDVTSQDCQILVKALT